ncbi:MAG: hypothetical protein NWF08_03745 [Candidatus Bathyarchaeota archaeon]|nr:hypothetical protein [Candidatus Bathyarchaeota archaeon]
MVIERFVLPLIEVLKKWLLALTMFLKSRLLSFVLVKKNRRWLLFIAIPAIVCIALIFFFSTFETHTYQTREGHPIVYREPLSSRALIPAYILWTSSILLIFAIVPISYYLVSRKLEERLEKNMKLISKVIDKNNSASKKKAIKMDNKEIIFKFLNLNERKVLEKLIEREGIVMQSEINLIEGMTKLKTHRAVKDLERKSIIKTESYGKTNRITLSNEIREFITK